MQEEQTLESEYVSVLALLRRFLDNAKHLDGINDDLFAQFQRAQERFNTLTIERDKTDFHEKDCCCQAEISLLELVSERIDHTRVFLFS